MTPKRRAALAKAQAASARKRKGRNRKVAILGGISAATVLGVGIAGYAGRRHIAHLVSGGSKTPRFDAYMAIPKQLALPAGTGVNTHRNTKLVFKTPRQPAKRNGAFKVPSGGLPYYVKRPRGIYDANRRAGRVKGYERKVRSKYAAKTFDGSGMSPRTQRRKKKNRGD